MSTLRERFDAVHTFFTSQHGDLVEPMLDVGTDVERPDNYLEVAEEALDLLDEMAKAYGSAHARISRLADMVEQGAGEMPLGQRTRQATRMLEEEFSTVLVKHEGKS